MKAFFAIFRLEFVSMVRSRALLLLALFALAWMFAVPYLITGDGTAEGAREISIRYGFGGVFVITLVSLLATASGSIARERAAKRLPLTMVRPVAYSLVVFAKAAALTLSGAIVLAIACLPALRMSADGRWLSSAKCNHVLQPLLPSPREEACAMYEVYMKDPETPPEVKRAKRSTVLRLLEARAMDHYQTIPTNETVKWKFNVSGLPAARKAIMGEGDDLPSVRLRLSNMNEVRQDVCGYLSIGKIHAVVSNQTLAVLTFPLSPRNDGGAAEENILSFRNDGSGTSLMLRPRKDVALLVPADAFVWNLFRAWCELVSILALTISFGLFLSSALGRPVALFSAIVILAVSEASPGVISQYPDELETKLSDRIALTVTRFVAEATQPVSSLNPLERLSLDECIEVPEVCRVAAVNLFLLPFLLSLLSGIVLPRKQDEV